MRRVILVAYAAVALGGCVRTEGMEILRSRVWFEGDRFVIECQVGNGPQPAYLLNTNVPLIRGEGRTAVFVFAVKFGAMGPWREVQPAYGPAYVGPNERFLLTYRTEFPDLSGEMRLDPGQMEVLSTYRIELGYTDDPEVISYMDAGIAMFLETREEWARIDQLYTVVIGARRGEAFTPASELSQQELEGMPVDQMVTIVDTEKILVQEGRLERKVP